MIDQLTGNETSATSYYKNHPCYRYFFAIYFLQGLFLFVANGLIFVAIALYKSLREKKEYIVIAGLALVDGANGFGLMLAGLYRSMMLRDGTADDLVSRINCLLTPWNVIFAVTDCLAHVYMLTISIDRYIAIKYPIKYYFSTTKYAYTLVGSTFLFQFINVTVGICVTLRFTYPERPKICYTSDALNEHYYIYHSWLATVCDILSIVVYIFVLRIYRSHVKVLPKGVELHQRSSGESSDHPSEEADINSLSPQCIALKAQMQVTITLAISSLCTLLLYCLPYCFKLIVRNLVSLELLYTVIPITFIINQLNPMTHFFIYTSRQKDIRTAVKNILTLKRLSKN